MRNFFFGILFGSMLTGTLVGAGSFYDSKGNVKAPAGSPQQFDYFRQRQTLIDINHLRQQQDQHALERKSGRGPC